jgi:hypothetical protein
MKFLSILSVVIMVGALSGCSSKYNKDALRSTKRVAIVSLYANEKVPEKRGRGLVKGWDETFKMRVAQDSADIFSASLAQIGWTVVSPDQVVRSDAYQKAFGKNQSEPQSKLEALGNKIGSFLMEQRRRNYFTPAGMHPIELKDQEANTYTWGTGADQTPKNLLAKFAKELNVDAVLLVQLDYCYEGGTFTSFGGLGEAFMTAATSLKAVNQKGQMIINMEDLATCADVDTRAASKGSVFMNGGDIVFGLGVGTPGSDQGVGQFVTPEKLQRLFGEATRSSAEIAVRDIKKGLK